MRDFVIIPAAGGVKDFWKPVSLLSLGKETVISRLLKQLRRAGGYPVIAIGSPGEKGWLQSHVDEFRKMPVWKELITSPHVNERSPLRTVEFLLNHLASNKNRLKADFKSKISIFFADWIFTDGLLVETLSYPAPSSFSHIYDEWGLVIRLEDVPAFLKFSGRFKSIGSLTQDKDGLKALGFQLGLGSQNNAPDRFCEIDLVHHYELAFRLVAKEWGGATREGRPLRNIEDWGIIPAAGGVYRHFWKPRALLTLGDNSLIGRLIEQYKKNGVYPVVGIGSAGPREGKGKFRVDLPWSEKDVKDFKELPCEVLVTPHHNERGPLKTIVFLMEHLLENFDVKDESKVYITYGDYVFSDKLFEEILRHRASSYSFLKKRDGFVGILTGAVMKDFVDLCKQWPDISSPLILHETVPGKLKSIGLEEVPSIRLPGPDFIEVDDPGGYEHAIRLVAHENKSRMW